MKTAGRPAPIYLDYHATTPVDPRVAAVVMDGMLATFGNANSVDHVFGEAAATLVVQARRYVAELVGADPEGVHFTSGSTESVQLAVRHAVARRPTRRGPLRIAATVVEHRAVLNAIGAAQSSGDAVIRWLEVDRQARLDLDALADACKAGVDLVCVMAANNEVGTLYPVEQIAKIASQAGAQTLIDATQAAGRETIHADAWSVTYLALSAHKLYGPKGVGALVTPAGLKVRTSHSTTPGTGDGTPNVPGIAGFGEACRLRGVERATDEPRIAQQRDRLEMLLLQQVPELVVNGDCTRRLSGNLHVAVPGVPNDAIVGRLRRSVAISTGAACTSGAQEGSHVLRAMGLSAAIQEGALRIGLGKFTTDDEVPVAAASIASAIEATRKAMSTG